LGMHEGPLRGVRRRRSMTALAVIASFGLVAAACGGGSKKSSNTSATPTSEETTSTTAGSSTESTAVPGATPTTAAPTSGGGGVTATTARKSTTTTAKKNNLVAPSTANKGVTNVQGGITNVTSASTAPPANVTPGGVLTVYKPSDIPGMDPTQIANSGSFDAPPAFALYDALAYSDNGRSSRRRWSR